jgi:hypothetical protein
MLKDSILAVERDKTDDHIAAEILASGWSDGSGDTGSH